MQLPLVALLATGALPCATAVRRTPSLPASAALEEVASEVGRLGKCSNWAAHSQSMSCGPGVQLCGVLTLETGNGDGVYHHAQPVVHGLWPQVPGYGDSQCVAPKSLQAANQLFPCYNMPGESLGASLGFQTHEWEAHGKCAGAQSAQDYFTQVCGLSAGPLQVLAAGKAAGLDLVGMADQLQRSGYCVWGLGNHAEVQLSACAGRDGRWRLADVGDFPAVCGSGPSNPTPTPTPAPPSPSPSPVGPAACVRGQHGPECKSDTQCAGVSGCVRCAKSGYCTDIP